MARQSNKSLQSQSYVFTPELGLDFSGPSFAIDPRSVTRALNFYYPPSSKRLTSRPGLKVVTTDANALPAGVLRLHRHYNGSETYLVAACADGKLYQMTKAVLEGATPAWTEIGSLTGGSVTPAMLTFNSKLLVADNGATIRYWNAAGTYGTLSGSPANCTALEELGARVWANSGATGELDTVWGSAPEDDTDWSTASNAVKIKAGFGDGLAVNGYAAFQKNNLIVSKRSVTSGEEAMYVVSLDGTLPTYATDLVRNKSAQSPQGIISAWNDVFFFDDDGLFNLAGVQEYGDIQLGGVGQKINPALDSRNTLTLKELRYSSILGCMFIMLSGAATMYVYTPWNQGFTEWSVDSTIISSVETLGEHVYFGTTDGRLLKLTESDAEDTYQEGVSGYFPQVVRTKKENFAGYGARLRRTAFTYMPKSDGMGVLEFVAADERTTSTLADFAVATGEELIGGATATTELIGGTYATTNLIGATSATPTDIVSRQVARDASMMFQVRLTSGARVEFGRIVADVAAPIGS